MKNSIREMLSGGDRRSIGRSDELVAKVRKDPVLFREVIQAMGDPDPTVKMRAADAAEKITAGSPDLLRPWKKFLLGKIAQIPQQEVRWHAAQMLPRLHLSPKEKASTVDILAVYLKDESRIVKTFALQALADLAAEDAALRVRVTRLAEVFIRSGSPAMRSRSRKILASLGKKSGIPTNRKLRAPFLP